MNDILNMLFDDLEDDEVQLDSDIQEEPELTEVQIHYDKLVNKTDKSYLFEINGIELWHPKKLITGLDTAEQTFFIPEWLYEKKKDEYNTAIITEFKNIFHDFLDENDITITNLNNNLMFNVEDLMIPIEDCIK
jgi:hypothetical protein